MSGHHAASLTTRILIAAAAAAAPIGAESGTISGDLFGTGYSFTVNHVSGSTGGSTSGGSGSGQGSSGGGGSNGDTGSGGGSNTREPREYRDYAAEAALAAIDQGDIYFAQGQLEDADASYAKALGLKPGNAYAAERLQAVRNMRVAKADGAIDPIRKARIRAIMALLEKSPIYRKIHTRDVADAAVMVKQGDIYLAQGRRDAAAAIYARAAWLDPSNAEAARKAMELQPAASPARPDARPSDGTRRTATAEPAVAREWVARAHELRAQGFNHDADEAFAHAVLLDPSNLEARQEAERITRTPSPPGPGAPVQFRPTPQVSDPTTPDALSALRGFVAEAATVAESRSAEEAQKLAAQCWDGTGTPCSSPGGGETTRAHQMMTAFRRLPDIPTELRAGPAGPRIHTLETSIQAHQQKLRAALAEIEALQDPRHEPDPVERKAAVDRRQAEAKQEDTKIIEEGESLVDEVFKPRRPRTQQPQQDVSPTAPTATHPVVAPQPVDPRPTSPEGSIP